MYYIYLLIFYLNMCVSVCCRYVYHLRSKIHKKEEKEKIHICVKCCQVSAALRLGVMSPGVGSERSGDHAAHLWPGCLRLTPCPLLSLMKARALVSWSRPGPGDSALLSARSVPIITGGHKH